MTNSADRIWIVINDDNDFVAAFHNQYDADKYREKSANWKVIEKGIIGDYQGRDIYVVRQYGVYHPDTLIR